MMLLIVGLGLATWATPVGAKVAQEYDLKAVFLLHFARFVDWPATTFEDPSAPLVIGVLGNDPFGGILEEAVSNESAHERKLIVRHCHTAEDANACQILFIPQAEDAEWQHLAAHLLRHSTLTVGESKGFALTSGMIGFEPHGRRLRVCINVAAATAAHLTISSQLLRQAEIVSATP